MRAIMSDLYIHYFPFRPNKNSTTRNMEQGQYKISCRACNFEGLWSSVFSGVAYAPEVGCHKSEIGRGWCNSCGTITQQHSGQAGSYEISDFGVRNKYERFGPPEVRRSLFGGKALPWASAQWHLKELKNELRELISDNSENPGLIQRILNGKKLKQNAQRIQACNEEVEQCEEWIPVCKNAHERAMQAQEAANEFFGFTRKPRCFECASDDVIIGQGETIPHACGSALQFDQQTREHTNLGGITYRYYDNTGRIVRTEMKSIYA